MSKIRIKRGLKLNLPVLDIGELAFCTDTKEIFIGTSTGNALIKNIDESEYASIPQYVIKDVWTTFGTRNFSDNMNKFYISNIGSSDITFKINNISSVIKPMEEFEETYDPFVKVIITGFSNFIARVSALEIDSPLPEDSIKDSFVGSSNLTKTFLTPINNIVISNDHTSSMTYVINGMTIPVEPKEISEISLSPFTQVVINATGPYRVYAKGNYNNTLTDTTPPVITASPNGGLFANNQTLTLSSNKTANIYYTIDGSIPTKSSSVYSTPITVSSSSDIKYFAEANAGNISDVQTVTFTIDKLAPVITASPNGGLFNSNQNVTLSSNETATIYYTTDGSTPTQSSSVYGSTILINATKNLKYFGKDIVGNVSAVQAASFTIDTVVPTISASVASGSYNTTQSVVLSSDKTATIYYTTDGSTPTVSSSVYSAVLSISVTTTLKYFGKDTAGNISSVQTRTYTIDTIAPTITPSVLTGSYSVAQSVTLSADETATIYYTTNGSTPTTGSSVYSSAIPISATTTLKYFGRDTAGNSSSVQTQTYTITSDITPPIVTISPNAGTYNTTQSVTLSANETATIYYTTNGSVPTTSSSVYSSAISISTTTTLKYFGKDTAGNSSSVQTAVFTIDVTNPNPVTGLTVGTPTSMTIPVSWTLSSSGDVANYEVAYSTNGTTYTVSSSTVASNATSYTVTGLTQQTAYTIRVVAIDQASNRSTATTVSGTTASAAVTPVSQSDTFNRADSTTTLGSTNAANGGTISVWIPSGATYGIISNQAYKQSAQTGSVAVVEGFANDGTVSAKFAVNTTGSKLVFRYLGNFNMMYVVNNSTNYLVVKRLANVDTTLATINVTPANNDVVTINLAGSSITTLINGANSTSVTDGFNMNESLYGFGLDDTTARVDDFQINGYQDVSGAYTYNPTTTSIIVASTASTSAVSYDFYVNGVFSLNQASSTRTFTGLTPATTYQFKIIAVYASGNKSSGKLCTGATLLSSVPTIDVFDDFNRMDQEALGISTSGHLWTIPQLIINPTYSSNQSGMVIRSNKVVNKTSVACPPIVTTNGKSDNIKISFDGVAYRPTGFPNIQLIFRASDHNNYWSFGRSNAQVHLQKISAGSTTTMASYSYNFNSVSLPHPFVVELRGSRILCYINGVLMFDYTDAFNQSSIYHGGLIYFQEFTAFDNFSITDIVSAAPSAHPAPTEVSSVVATPQANGTSIIMTWVGSPNAYAYDIFVNGTLKTTVLQVQTASVNQNYTITGLTSATTYTIKIQAKDGSGNVTNGVTVNSTTL